MWADFEQLREGRKRACWAVVPEDPSPVCRGNWNRSPTSGADANVHVAPIRVLNYLVGLIKTKIFKYDENKNILMKYK